MTQSVGSKALKAERHEYGDYAALLEDYYDRGWTDGLPVVPPTPEAVEQFLDYAGLAPDEVLGSVPTREVVVTAEHAAINAVMAGCRVEYFPVVVAAVRAHLHEKANCHSTTGTLSGAAQIVIVNGPIRRQLDINCEAGCFGPGWRANATIGRALRLVIRNVCRAVPNFLDRATFSRPARYSFCFGENEEASSWVPMHVERGFAPGSNAVTVHSAMTITSAEEMVARTPEGILDTVCQTMQPARHLRRPVARRQHQRRHGRRQRASTLAGERRLDESRYQGLPLAPSRGTPRAGRATGEARPPRWPAHRRRRRARDGGDLALFPAPGLGHHRAGGDAGPTSTACTVTIRSPGHPEET